MQQVEVINRFGHPRPYRRGDRLEDGEFIRVPTIFMDARTRRALTEKFGWCDHQPQGGRRGYHFDVATPRATSKMPLPRPTRPSVPICRTRGARIVRRKMPLALIVPRSSRSTRCKRPHSRLTRHARAACAKRGGSAAEYVLAINIHGHTSQEDGP
jgi:hypothetical protein